MKLIIALGLLFCVDLAAATLELNARSQAIPEGNKKSQYKILNATMKWEAKETAIVVCDMWDEHWCKGATRRVGEMAPRMNEVIRIARKRGVLIIHCPSSCMDFYKDSPMRELARQAPRAESRIPLQRWCHLDLKKEAPLPIDDSDGGCDCEPQCKGRKA